MKKLFTLFTIKGWAVTLEIDTGIDGGFYDDFHISSSISKRSEGRSLSKGILTRTKYPLTVELFNRRLIALRLVKKRKAGGINDCL